MIRKKLATTLLVALPVLCLYRPAVAQDVAAQEAQTAQSADAAQTAAAPTAKAQAAAAEPAQPSEEEPAAADEAAPVDEPVAGAIEPQEQTVLRAQVLLDRANFSSGEIDGRTGSNFKTALAAFQRNRGLEDDGSLGPMTWAELERDAVPTLVEYTVLAADVAGPFVELPKGMVERSKLPALGFTTADEALGERFHVSPKFLRSLNPGTDITVAGATIEVPNVLDAPAPAAPTQVIVDRSDKTLMLADAEGKVIAQFPSSTGSEKDPLPIGDWKIDSIAVNPAYYYNPALFWDADPTDEKAKLPPGPNNPVGVAWIDLSKEHYGIHGTPEPSRIGKTQSYGCIRVTNWTASLLTSVVKAGMPVVLRE